MDNVVIDSERSKKQDIKKSKELLGSQLYFDYEPNERGGNRSKEAHGGIRIKSIFSEINLQKDTTIYNYCNSGFDCSHEDNLHQEIVYSGCTTDHMCYLIRFREIRI